MKYLHLRGNVYYFRWTLPLSLRKLTKLTEIKRSLGTGIESLALRRAASLFKLIEDLPFMDERELLRMLAEVESGGFTTQRVKFKGLTTTTGDYIAELEVDPSKPGDVEAATQFVQSVFVPQKTSSARSSDSEMLSSLIDAYLKEKETDKGWAVNTVSDYRSLFQQLLRILGEDIRVTEVNHESARRVKDVLRNLPPNVTKAAEYKGKSLDEILALGHQAISVSTFNKGMNRLSGLFEWLFNHGYIEQRFFQKMGVKDYDDPKEKRRPFISSELEHIFNSANSWGTGYSYYYWVPRIALFNGMRLNEVCQLYLSDIREESGVWVFDINDEAEKTLKNKSAKRVIPINPVLIELGLLDFHTELVGGGKHFQLFPSLPFNGTNHRRKATRWFQEVRKKLCLHAQKPMVDFHSFRHNFTTALVEAGTEETKVARIVGNKIGKTEAVNRYAKSQLLPMLYSELEKVRFDISSVMITYQEFLRMHGKP